MPNAGSMLVSGITGTSIESSRQGNIVVVAFTLEVKADLDPITRRPNGKRTHSPLVVSKNIDFATPELHKSHMAGTAHSLTLKLYHMPRDGNEFNYFIIHVAEAKIVSINTVMPDTNTSEMMHEYEEVSFAYKSIGYEITAPRDKSIEKGMWNQYRMDDPDGLLAKPIKFGPEWSEEKSKDALKKVYAQAQLQAKKEFDDELKSLQKGK